MYIYLDIETIPTQRDDVYKRIADDITAPAQYKKPESIDAWHETHGVKAADEQWRRTALDGGYGELACICAAVGDELVMTFGRHSVDESERDVLTEFHAWLADTTRGQMPTYVGHNVGFDLSFWHHRAVVLQAKPPVFVPHNVAPWADRYICTMFQWAGARGSVKLKTLCDMLGIDAEDDIDGAQVWDHFHRGDVASVLRHCALDVERVRQIHKRLNFR